jgi:hypothetical protein
MRLFECTTLRVQNLGEAHDYFHSLYLQGHGEEDTALNYLGLLEQEGDPAEVRVVGWALVLTPAAHIGEGFIA